MMSPATTVVVPFFARWVVIDTPGQSRPRTRKVARSSKDPADVGRSRRMTPDDRAWTRKRADATTTSTSALGGSALLAETIRESAEKAAKDLDVHRTIMSAMPTRTWRKG